MKGGTIIMKRINGNLYYNLRETAFLLKVTKQTVLNWIHIDKTMKDKGEDGFLPNPTKSGNAYYFGNWEVVEIRYNVSKFKRGDFAPYQKKETSYQKMKRQNEELKKKLSKLEGSETK